MFFYCDIPLLIINMMMIMIWFCLFMSFIAKARSSDLVWHYYCKNTTSYTPNSTYKANLDSLLSNLYSNATRNNGFYHATVAGSRPSDTVHGLFLCRGDVSAHDCQTCVGEAREMVFVFCDSEKTAMIWFANCMLRYSENPVLGIMDDQSTQFAMRNPFNDTYKPDELMKVVGNMLDQITARASIGSGKKFAVLQTNFSAAAERVYALGQCTPDLSKVDCKICFRNVIKYMHLCCFGNQGATVLFPSCNIRYELYPFYFLSPSAAPPPPPPPPSRTPPPIHHLPQTPTIVPSSATNKGNKGKSSAKVIVASVVSVAGIILLFALSFCFLKMKRAKKSHSDLKETTSGMSNKIPTEESVQYEFSTIEAITNCFSADNKIGEGGYGAVYKGRLPNGQEVAVKRLSSGSTQGDGEFKNEVALIAKLQHKNLVKLMGFCIEREEKILVYEFVPNKSLDYFLFDPEKKQLLNWPTRYKIIGGIARGLLYLHQDSHLKVIHRDLKASNVLLDRDMDPKISDFGLARILMIDQTQGSTSRIIGTYGYMSPEYVMHGMFSEKSDVYSFGVLLLEIVTGKKTTSFPSSTESLGAAQDLIGYAWKHWKEDTSVEMVDQSLGGLYSRNEVIQCIHVGLLCVQEDVDARPTMANVVLMLNSNSATRRTPNPPIIFECGSETTTLSPAQ